MTSNITNTFGYEYTSFDWENIPNDFTDVFFQNKLVVIRNDKPVLPEHMANLMETFGKVHIPDQLDASTLVDDSGKLTRVSNIKGDDGKAIGVLGKLELPWHSDASYVPGERHGMMLYNHSNGHTADTFWLDTEALWNTLTEDEQNELRDVIIYHRFRGGMSQKHIERLKKIGLAGHEINPPVPRPLVFKHPYTGRTAMYISPGSAGDTKPETDLTWLFDRMETMPIMKADWKPYDAVFFDNLSLEHRRSKIQGKRVLYRGVFDYSGVLNL